MIDEKRYLDDMNTAIFKAILDCGKRYGDESTAILLSGEISVACLNTLALVTHSSKEVDTPAKRADFCRRVAVKLSSKIAAIQEMATNGDVDFITTVKNLN